MTRRLEMTGTGPEEEGRGNIALFLTGLEDETRRKLLDEDQRSETLLSSLGESDSWASARDRFVLALKLISFAVIRPAEFNIC